MKGVLEILKFMFVMETSFPNVVLYQAELHSDNSSLNVVARALQVFVP